MTGPQDAVRAADTFDVERGPDVFTPLAQAAYEAYSARTRGRSAVSGAKLPTWEGLLAQPTGELVQSAWRNAAKTVAMMCAYTPECDREHDVVSSPPYIPAQPPARQNPRYEQRPDDSDVSTEESSVVRVNPAQITGRIPDIDWSEALRRERGAHTGDDDA